MSTSIPTRKIGDTLVPTIGFGAMGISVGYGAVESDEERFKVLDAAYEAGTRHFDTANCYGDSEDLIGKWLKRTGNRDSIFLATKFGIDFATQLVRGDAEYAKQQFNKSLERLGVDYVDLLYLHRPDTKTPIEITVSAMSEFVKAGKVKYLGLSDCSSKTLRRAHAVHPIATFQTEFSPFVLEIEDPKVGILETARELGVKIIAYSPLARGLVAGQIKSVDDFEADDCRWMIPKYSAENFPKILALVDQLREIGKKHNATPGQVTLAWILAQGDDFFVIPGTKKAKYVIENAGAGSVHLSKEDIDAVRKIAEEACAVPGSREIVPFHFIQSFKDTPELEK